MVTWSNEGITRHRLRQVFSMALVLAAAIFFFHTSVLFEVARHLIAVNTWLTGNYGTATAGKSIVLVSFSPSFLPISPRQPPGACSSGVKGCFRQWHRICVAFSMRRIVVSLPALIVADKRMKTPAVSGRI